MGEYNYDYDRSKRIQSYDGEVRPQTRARSCSAKLKHRGLQDTVREFMTQLKGNRCCNYPTTTRDRDINDRYGSRSDQRSGFVTKDQNTSLMKRSASAYAFHVQTQPQKQGKISRNENCNFELYDSETDVTPIYIDEFENHRRRDNMGRDDLKDISYVKNQQKKNYLTNNIERSRTPQFLDEFNKMKDIMIDEKALKQYRDMYSSYEYPTVLQKDNEKRDILHHRKGFPDHYSFDNNQHYITQRDWYDKENDRDMMRNMMIGNVPEISDNNINYNTLIADNNRHAIPFYYDNPNARFLFKPQELNFKQSNNFRQNVNNENQNLKYGPHFNIKPEGNKYNHLLANQILENRNQNIDIRKYSTIPETFNEQILKDYKYQNRAIRPIEQEQYEHNFILKNNQIYNQYLDHNDEYFANKMVYPNGHNNIYKNKICDISYAPNPDDPTVYNRASNQQRDIRPLLYTNNINDKISHDQNYDQIYLTQENKKQNIKYFNNPQQIKENCITPLTDYYKQRDLITRLPGFENTANQSYIPTSGNVMMYKEPNMHYAASNPLDMGLINTDRNKNTHINQQYFKPSITIPLNEYRNPNLLGDHILTGNINIPNIRNSYSNVNDNQLLTGRNQITQPLKDLQIINQPQTTSYLKTSQPQTIENITGYKNSFAPVTLNNSPLYTSAPQLARQDNISYIGKEGTQNTGYMNVASNSTLPILGNHQGKSTYAGYTGVGVQSIMPEYKNEVGNFTGTKHVDSTYLPIGHSRVTKYMNGKLIEQSYNPIQEPTTSQHRTIDLNQSEYLIDGDDGSYYDEGSYFDEVGGTRGYDANMDERVDGSYQIS